MRTYQNRQMNTTTKIWFAIVIVLSMIVATITIYSLVLPARTMEVQEMTAEEQMEEQVVVDEENTTGSSNDAGVLSADEQTAQVQSRMTEITSAKPQEQAAVSTGAFVKLNVFDYYGEASASAAGKENINTLWKSNKKYPGFQWNGGAYMTAYAFRKWRVDNIDYGNSMITDFKYGSTYYSDNRVAPNFQRVGGQGGTINQVIGYTNQPIGMSSGSAYDAIKHTVVDGYPALTDGTSLKYLFTESEYASKLNTENVDGLFQQDKVSGEYYYDSRDNHAYYNNNSFTLYKQMITPNFILYPFGNFLPLNDITDPDKVTQVSAIESVVSGGTGYAGYMQTIINRLLEGSEDATEQQLIDMLARYRNSLSEYQKTHWTVEDSLNYYFDNSAEFGDENVDFWSTEMQALLNDLYNIDFDVPKNFMFGMNMEMNLLQPKDGMTGNDTNQDGRPDYPMKFYFAGDDDVWVFIDGILFMDLTGIHRHVGGDIDFVNGKVNYYMMESYVDGAVKDTPYKTMTFEEILMAGGADPAQYLKKDDSGKYTTFKDYSSHNFKFYYMERGTGSSVCCMNFNFPMLKQNTISVAKDVTSDENTLGDPDFSFQILKANSDGSKPEEDKLFIGANTSYKVYDESDNLLRTAKTDENGVFKLKKGERAEFEGITENSGKYYVRELFEEGVASQYDKITVSGETTTRNDEIIIGSETFTGVESPVKDSSDGSTQFRFTNDIDTAKLATLKISKEVIAYGGSSNTDTEFVFSVVLDGQPIPAGTKYKVGNEERVVASAGLISLKHGETAEISGVKAGSEYVVTEVMEPDSDYAAIYNVYINSKPVSDTENADGTIVTGNNKIEITNTEKGTTLAIPISKTISDPNQPQSFRFQLVETDEQWKETDGGTVQETVIDTSVQSPEGTAEFSLLYPKGSQNGSERYHYYEIREIASGGSLMDNDDTVYRVAVKVINADGELSASIDYMAASQENNEDFAAVESISFDNKQLYSLTLSKEVEDKPADDTIFEFTVTLKDEADVPISGDFDCTGSGDACQSCIENGEKYLIRFDENGQASVRLKHGESLTINGLLAGTHWNVKENATLSDGYKAYYQINGSDKKEGFICDGGSIEAGSIDNGVIFINEAVYMLPQTGGVGDMPFVAAGSLLIAGAALMMVRRFKREN